MKLQPALQTFVIESRELLRELEQAMLQLEKSPDDADALNAALRAAHTIKGSSGLFGFDTIVAFSHLMESVLVDIRVGDIPMNVELSAMLLECADHLARLIDYFAEGGVALDEVDDRAGRDLAARMQACLNPQSIVPESALPEPAAPAQSHIGAEAQVESLGGDTVTSDIWHISLRFGENILRNGMDPLPFIHYLATLGEIMTITPLFDAMPSAAEMDAESCYLGLEINFRGVPDKTPAIDKFAIEKVFEFVQDDCIIRILPPHSKILDYIQLVSSLPEDQTRLGELLVLSGALTQRELETGKNFFLMLY